MKKNVIVFAIFTILLIYQGNVLRNSQKQLDNKDHIIKNLISGEVKQRKDYEIQLNNRLTLLESNIQPSYEEEIDEIHKCLDYQMDLIIDMLKLLADIKEACED